MAQAAQTANPALATQIAADRDAAAAVIDDQLKPGDLVLVKASRSLGLEDLATSLAATR